MRGAAEVGEEDREAVVGVVVEADHVEEEGEGDSEEYEEWEWGFAGVLSMHRLCRIMERSSRVSGVYSELS